MHIQKYEAEFASQVMETIPVGFIDKTVCGVGITSVMLENEEDVILAVPSLNLIVNKVTQYPNERCSFEILGVHGGINKDDVENYQGRCYMNQPLKILVTYDSLNKVDYLLDRCRLVIDESDKLLNSSELKSNSKGHSNMDAISRLFGICGQNKNNVSFVSATPTPLKYLPKWVSTIPQIKMEWSNMIEVKPIVMERSFPMKALKEEVILPIEKYGSVSLGDRKFSKAIIFVNSVSEILNIVNDANVNKEKVAIICGDNIKNDVKLNGISRLKDLKKLPQYTFITSSGFQGIDLYDEEAMSVVVSSTKRNHQMIDAATDLKQAISRQRIKTNPNYNRYVFIYNVSAFTVSEAELIKNLNEKKDRMQRMVTHNNASMKLASDFYKIVKTSADSSYINFVNGKLVFNEVVYEATRYFILETRKLYTKGFRVKGANDIEIENVAPIKTTKLSFEESVKRFKKNKTNPDWSGVPISYRQIIENCWRLHGRIWTKFNVAKEMATANDDLAKLKARANDEFKQGGRYRKSHIKSVLNSIYSAEGIKRKAKWTDLMELFTEVKEITIRGVRLVSVLKK